MSTFSQTLHADNTTPVQNAGQMDLTVNNNRRYGDKIVILGKVGTLASLGGSEVQNTLYSQPPGENPTTTGILFVPKYPAKFQHQVREMVI